MLTNMKSWICAPLLCASLSAARSQRPVLAPAVRPYVRVDTAVVAITHVRVIDGTGAAPRTNQTVIIREGSIAAIGDADRTVVPAGAQIIDATGKSLLPGLVMVHEHLFYPTGPGVYGNLTESFTRLYLAGGVTSMRTGGNMNGYGELNIKRSIDAGQKAGPWLDATAPYLEGAPAAVPQLYTLKDGVDATRFVDFWAAAGATSFKAYMHVTRAELKAAIDAAHRRGMKVTGHLCSVTYREAASLGIDNLEHGFFVATDFVGNKQPDVCPGQAVGQAAVNAVDPNSESVKSLFAYLIAQHVAITSTPTVFETFVPGRPDPPGLDVLDPQLLAQFKQRHDTLGRVRNSIYSTLYPKDMAMELAFARAGGTLLVGTDPTGGGGVIPGFSNQRALELLVEAGFTPLEAIKIGTLNGAKFLGRGDHVGSLVTGKQADLVLVTGDPSTTISDIEHVEMVFKQGVGYDPRALIASVKGQVGLF